MASSSQEMHSSLPYWLSIRSQQPVVIFEVGKTSLWYAGPDISSTTTVMLCNGLIACLSILQRDLSVYVIDCAMWFSCLIENNILLWLQVCDYLCDYLHTYSYLRVGISCATFMVGFPFRMLNFHSYLAYMNKQNR